MGRLVRPFICIAKVGKKGVPGTVAGTGEEAEKRNKKKKEKEKEKEKGKYGYDETGNRGAGESGTRTVL